MITSIQNERIKYVRSLGRRRVRQREGRFVVEGSRLIGEMIRAGIKPALALFTDRWLATQAGQETAPALEMAEEGSWLVSETVMAACADTQSPQGVLAVIPIVGLPPQPGLILILDQLRDPGNLGTILRSAEASGTGQVILTPGSVDAYSPKVVRGAMGAHFRLSVSHHDWPEIEKRTEGRDVWLADASGEVAYEEVDWTQPCAVLVGGEAAGVGERATALATGRVFIPMTGQAESLNAAMAATVVLFEAARQRRVRVGKGS
jgi:TrmH family RNA methyltransferase